MKVGKRILFTCAFACVTVSLFGQEEGLSVVRVNRQRWFPAVPAGNYSGVAYIGHDLYALVDDKQDRDGFRVVRIERDSLGAVTGVQPEYYATDSASNRDAEGIAFVPERGTVFTCGEMLNDIMERKLDGMRTGVEVSVPRWLKSSRKNNGLESLTYNSVTKSLWTCSETTLLHDGDAPTPQNGKQSVIRLQKFNENLYPVEQYLYLTDKHSKHSSVGSYVLGISELCALDDGTLLVLEREALITSHKLGSFVTCKLYQAFPEVGSSVFATDTPIEKMTPIRKKLLYKWTTRMTLFHQDFANYEGMCLMPPLEDGSLVLLLVADSQNQYGGLLRDWFMTIVLR